MTPLVCALTVVMSIAAEGRNRRGETRLRGQEVLGPLRGLGIRPLVLVTRGLGNPLPRSQGLGGGSSAERCVRFQRSRERSPQATDNYVLFSPSSGCELSGPVLRDSHNMANWVRYPLPLF